MNRDLIKAINQEVYRRFPEVEGKQPKVRQQNSSGERSEAKATTYLLIYQGHVTTSTNRIMTRLVRVVANDQGKILKITTSH